MEATIIILPCKGDSTAGRITWLAAQELVLAGKAQWCLSWLQIEEILEEERGASLAYLVVDGCEQRCLFKELLAEGLVGRHHLALSDVGIDFYAGEIERRDIDLVKEAIIAECRPVKRDMPPPLGGCCCP